MPFGTLLTDLSKAFDFICHDLLVAKLHAYGLSLPALKMIQNYLLNRKQRTKIGFSYSTWENIIYGILQGSILGPLLFNVYLCDLFLEHEDCCFTNYADDTTPYVVTKNTADVIENFAIVTQKLFTWFANNQMKVNHEKCHLLLSTQDEENIQIGNTTIKRSKSKSIGKLIIQLIIFNYIQLIIQSINYLINKRFPKLLEITLDDKLKFDKHVENICQKASKKLNALARVTNHIQLPKRRILMNAFFKAQFNYCPAVWMFHNRSLKSKISRFHERYLRIIYNDKHSNFEKLFVKDNSVSIHHNNIHTLAIEMHKVANGMSPEIMNDIFKLRENTHYNMRHTSQFLQLTVLIQFTVYLMVVNQHCIWEANFRNNYPLELKILTPLLGLKKKLENGNLRIASVEFAKLHT